jgi:hypothetical protein
MYRYYVFSKDYIAFESVANSLKLFDGTPPPKTTQTHYRIYRIIHYSQ